MSPRENRSAVRLSGSRSTGNVAKRHSRGCGLMLIYRAEYPRRDGTSCSDHPRRVIGEKRSRWRNCRRDSSLTAKLRNSSPLRSRQQSNLQSVSRRQSELINIGLERFAVSVSDRSRVCNLKRNTEKENRVYESWH